MAVDAGLIDWVAEALEPLGAVSSRAMMGGATLYLDGTVFAIIADDYLWFKADKVSDPVWDEAGCPRFTFQMGDREGSMNYRRAPDEAYDEAEVVRRLSELALEAGRRAPPKKPRKKKEA